MSHTQSDNAVALASGVSREYLLYHRVCPQLIAGDGSLVVATAPDAIVPDALDDLAVAYRRRVVAQETPRHEVERLIARLTTGGEQPLTLDTAREDDALVADVRDVANSAPVAAYVTRDKAGYSGSMVRTGNQPVA